jgi:uncharacterized repeat protein (TIGR03803 family)
VNDKLYGTTETGGASGDGTVFEISTAGKERVIYSFTGKPDGASPQASLISVNGALYGTTTAGGTSNYGTVFEISRSGKERVVYSFKGGTDGANPAASLINVNGTLYGTTTAGGGASGSGTVFSVNRWGKETVLYGFKGGTDGAVPSASLIDVNGTLYGTTFLGGSSGFGTVFKLPLRCGYNFQASPTSN